MNHNWFKSLILLLTLSFFLSIKLSHSSTSKNVKEQVKAQHNYADFQLHFNLFKLL